MQLLPQGSNANSRASSRASSRANPRILTKRSFPAFRRERRHCFAHTRKKWRRNTENKERPSMTDFTCRVQPIPDAETDWVHSTCRIQVNKKCAFVCREPHLCMFRALETYHMGCGLGCGFRFLYSFAPLLSYNNKQRDALTTVQNSGKFSPIHNISINAIPICEKGNSDFARIMLLYGSEKHMNQRKECLT